MIEHMNEINDINGKAVLVTGGGRGIGAAIALRLARNGADVALTYESNADRANAVVDEIKNIGRRGLAIQADSADDAALTGAVNDAAAMFGRLDILVNNAAVFPVAPVDDICLEDLDRALMVNVRAPFLASQAAARHMTEGGRIISIGSNVAVRTPFPGFALYAMSKSALVGMTKGLARDLGPRGITANLVHPGATDTELNPADGPNAAAIRGFTALDRFAVPDEIAATVAHLAGPGGAYITGAEFHVDGGFTV
jgi:3-oxoacyl-[acyl-carrier protein] reductase